MNPVLEWQNVLKDNSDPENTDRGIIRFARHLFPQAIDDRYGTPEIHKDIYRNLLDLYNPSRRFPIERQLQLIVFRGAAKSTISNFIFAAYVICFNGNTIILPNNVKVELEEDLIVIGSETNTFAVNWVSRIRQELAINKDLKLIFGKMKPSAVKDEEGKWRLNAFTAIKSGFGMDGKYNELYKGRNVTVVGLGVGQQTRGLNIGGRPSLVIADDLYSAKGVITDEARIKTRYWFENELVNTLDSVKGKIVSIGTVVHEDTIIVDNKNSRFWQTVEYPLMDVEKFNILLKKHCKINRDLRSCIIPNSGECEELEKQGFITNWTSRFPIESVLMKLAEKIEKPAEESESGFWQEYFHLIVAERDKAIRANQIVVVDFPIACKGKQTFVGISKAGEIEWRNVNTILVVDSATSEELGMAKTALVWVGMDYLSNIYVLYSNSGQYGVFDTLDEETQEKKIGVVDEIFRIIKEHHVRIGIEVYNIGNEILRQLNLAGKTRGKRLPTFPITQTEDKLERIIQTLSPYYQSKSVLHRPGQSQLIHQLELLGKTKYRDEADAFEAAVRNLQRPTVRIPFKDNKIQKPINMMSKILNRHKAPKKDETWRTL